jgi:hypothetical protein
VCPDVVLASLSVFAQVGCPMDLSGGLQNIGPTGSFTAGLPPTLGALVPPNGDLTRIAIAPTLSGLGPGNPAVSVLPGSITDVPIGFKNVPATEKDLQQLYSLTNLAAQVQKLAGNDPGVQQNLQAVGQRVEAVLNQKATDPDGLVISLKNRHMVVDRFSAETACGGQVAIRLYATGTIKTSTSSDKLDIYGDIYTL